ncbi:group 1 glycosyl transferase, partial [Pseudomonas syringae pv. actinidiae ICMP 19096]
PLALREAMRQLWEAPEQAAEYGQNALARFQKLFTAERMCASTVQVYRDLLK